MKKLIRFTGTLGVLLALASCDAADPSPGAQAAGLSGGDASSAPVFTDAVDETPRFTYIACLTDTHIVLPDDPAAQNLRQLVQTVNGLPYDLAGVFVGGDIVYTLPYDDIQAYHDDPNDRFDITQSIFEGFEAPVYPAVGNHDLDFPDHDAGMVYQLFKEHFGTEPYYAVDLGTWKFIVLDNFRGPTQDPSSPEYDMQQGSLGAEQTAWLEAQLADGRPAILMTHFPMFVMADLPAFAEKHKDTIRLILTGHSHAWINLSDNFSVPSMILGSSQYDADSFMVMELDNVMKTWRVVDWDRFHWGTSFAKTWGADE
jgi:hypothetical protein